MKNPALLRSGPGCAYLPRGTARSREDAPRAWARRLLWSSRTAAIGVLALVGIALTGCADPMTIGAVEPTPTVYAPPPTHIPPPPPGPTPAALAFPLPAPTKGEKEPVDDQTCVLCHTNSGMMKQMASVVEVKESASEGERWGGSLPPLEAWEKVLIDDPTFLETIHGRYGCISCHGGVGGSTDKAVAHEGVVREPDSAQVCAACHPDQVAAEPQSLHSNLAGYTAALAARSAPDKITQLEVMLDNHCNTCHTTCGQCHVSRPTNLGGGLVAGHQFQGIPPMNLTCTGCHGSRIENEYKGKNSGVPADVHWIEGGMSCFECHSENQIHGLLGESNSRYDGPPIPSCRDAGCHPEVAPGDGIAQHTDFHFQALSCQVCHSTTYKNCYNCHVGQEDGVPYFKTDESQMLFKIGLNPLQSQDRPWTYVPVRHVPIDPASFAYYGENLLPNFDVLPTWKYATPHNIQRITPQNETCGSCHGNPEFFLTADDLSRGELEANQDVIVEDLPFSMP